MHVRRGTIRKAGHFTDRSAVLLETLHAVQTNRGGSLDEYTARILEWVVLRKDAVCRVVGMVGSSYESRWTSPSIDGRYG